MNGQVGVALEEFRRIRSKEQIQTQLRHHYLVL
jgi:ribosomal protein S21